MVKDNDGVVTHYHYDLQGRLLAETDSDGTLRRAVVWYGDTPAALIDIEPSEPTFFTCTTTESLTGAAGPGMTLDTVTHTVVIESGDYAGTYAISDENWQVYSSGIVFIWSDESFQIQGGFAPDYELPTRSGGLVFYQKDDEGNFEISDLYKLWKESESGAIATPYQVHTDQIGAPILLTDATGTAVWSAQYAPFGQATINSDVDGDGTEVICNLRFPGQYFDAESGLHYNWHRYYEPRSGRYITLDPIGLAGGDVNFYRYVGGNPINRIDPTGFAWNASFGSGGAGNILAPGVTADSGIAVDSNGTICFYSTICYVVGWNSLSGGGLGLVGSVGSGTLCSGKSKSAGAYYFGGSGLGGEAQMLIGEGGLSFSRALGGIAAGAGSGYIECETEYFCINESDECGCDE